MNFKWVIENIRTTTKSWLAAYEMYWLTHQRPKLSSHKNQWIDLLWKLINWFLYDRNFGLQSVKIIEMYRRHVCDMSLSLTSERLGQYNTVSRHVWENLQFGLNYWQIKYLQKYFLWFFVNSGCGFYCSESIFLSETPIFGL